MTGKHLPDGKRSLVHCHKLILIRTRIGNIGAELKRNICRRLLYILVAFTQSPIYSFLMVEQISIETNKYTGSCLCGSVTVALDGSPLKTMSCHCTDCQKSSGGPYQTNAMYESSSVTVNDPEEFVKVYVVPKETTGSGVEKQKWFCGNCGCTLFTRPMKYNGEKSVVKTGILDTPAGYTGSRYLLNA